MTPNIFLAALDVLDELGWTQDFFETRDGRVCLVGALSRVPATSENVSLAYRRLCRLADTPVLSDWNDAPERSEEDVRLLLKRAAVELEAEVGA